MEFGKILISAASYLFNIVIFNCQSDTSIVPSELPKELPKEDEEPYTYFSLQPIPKNAPNVEKMNLYSTIVHVLFLHIMPISVGSYCVIKT